MVQAWAVNPEFYLENRLPKTNGRYKTFVAMFKLLEKRKAKILVETGTERWKEAKNCFDGDGGATILLSHWAKDHNAILYSVDINETHLSYCDYNIKDYKPHVQLVHSDSVAFLEQFSKPIDFLYLDSYDYSEKDPDPAQQHCLREIQAAEDKLHDRSIVMIDDCNIPGGGKGLLAIQYLLSRGWVLHRNKHQVILLKQR